MLVKKTDQCHSSRPYMVYIQWELPLRTHLIAFNWSRCKHSLPTWPNAMRVLSKACRPKFRVLRSCCILWHLHHAEDRTCSYRLDSYQHLSKGSGEAQQHSEIWKHLKVPAKRMLEYCRISRCTGIASAPARPATPPTMCTAPEPTVS